MDDTKPLTPPRGTARRVRPSTITVPFTVAIDTREQCRDAVAFADRDNEGDN